jgi:hypothetical protein
MITPSPGAASTPCSAVATREKKNALVLLIALLIAFILVYYS